MNSLQNVLEMHRGDKLMRKESRIKQLINWIEEKQFYFHSIFLIILSVSFLTTDWIVGVFSFSELMLIPIFPFLFFININRFKKKDWVIIGSFIVLIISNIFFNFQLNESFLLRPAIAAGIKATFYIFLVASFYRHIRRYQLEHRLLIYLNVCAFLSLLIGIYIYIAILTDGLPYEFLWRFTRTDIQSYYFRDTRYLIRMRSLFAEPAHFGFFLNTVIGLNLFQHLKFKVPILFTSFLIVGVLMTFSFSSILILCILLSIFMIEYFIKNRGKFSLINIIPLIVIIGLVVYFSWDYIDLTIIQRAQQIINGEDNSAIERIWGSWQFVNKDSIWLGNGLGNTPIIWNIYAYFLSDLGLLALIISVVVTLIILYYNVGLGSLFLLMNFQRGGYLSPSFSLFVVSILLFTFISDKDSYFTQSNKVHLGEI
jgi:hypothetical protein